MLTYSVPTFLLLNFCSLIGLLSSCSSYLILLTFCPSPAHLLLNSCPPTLPLLPSCLLLLTSCPSLALLLLTSSPPAHILLGSCCTNAALFSSSYTHLFSPYFPPAQLPLPNWIILLLLISPHTHLMLTPCLPSAHLLLTVCSPPTYPLLSSCSPPFHALCISCSPLLKIGIGPGGCFSIP